MKKIQRWAISFINGANEIQMDPDTYDSEAKAKAEVDRYYPNYDEDAQVHPIELLVKDDKDLEMDRMDALRALQNPGPDTDKQW